MLKTEFYPLYYKLHKKKRYLIWATNSDVEDTFYIDVTSQRVPIFTSLKKLRKYAKKQNIKVIKDKHPTIHNLDIILKWLKSSKKKAIEPEEILTAWNFFIDLANTFKIKNDELQAYRSKAPKAFKVYNKVFFGNNLPSITKDNPPYHPKFNKKEWNLIRRVLSFGLELTDKYIIKI